MLAKTISYLPAIIGLVLISLFVYLNNPKSTRNKTFALFNVSVAIWQFFLFLADIATNQQFGLWSLRLALFSGQLMFLFFYYFSLVFPFSVQTTIKKQAFYSLPIVFTSILLLTPLGVETVSIQSFGIQPEIIGPAYTLSDILGIVYLLTGMGVIIAKYKKSNAREKNQIKFMLFGLSIAVITNLVTGFVFTLLKVETNLILLGGISLFIFSLFVSYAIIKHRFFDIKLIVARAAGYVLSLGFVILITALLLFVVTDQLSAARIPTNVQQIFFVFTTLVLALLYQPMKRFFDKQTNKLFYRDAYDTQALLNDLNTSLVSIINLEKILQQTAFTIQNYMKVSDVHFVINRKSKQKLFSYEQSAETSSFKLRDFHLIERKIDQKIVALNFLEDEQSETRKLFTDNSISLVAQILSGTDAKALTGYLILGNKKSGNFLTEQDLRVVEIIADELVIALQNALRFQEIEQFNVTLQQKVDDATRKLRRANEKLIALDQTKDDFISMASHQLRTPLTSVKGYISMVIEGDVGKITKQQHKLLDQAFVSSQRMVYLIADLLNVSRLKTGKFIIEAKPTNLADVIEGELSQLTETAKSRSLELTYDKPKDFPELMLDDTKIRQVIMNFADNAIYYTPAGGKIEVHLEDKGETVEFTVVDNGIGVPKSEHHNLFNKFYRAGNAKKARPDGTGLGLFMAKKVIIAQGGSLIFKSEEGKGSTFGFSFSKAKLLPENYKSAHHLKA